MPSGSKHANRTSGPVERVESVGLVARSMTDQLHFVIRQAESLLPSLADQRWAHAAVSELLGEARETLRLVNTLQDALAAHQAGQRRDGSAA